MKILIAEDDFASRKLLLKILSSYGECDTTVNGLEAIEAFLMATDEGKPYDLICLDIMMPKIDGVKVLKYIREKEEEIGLTPDKKVKIIMTTALTETNYVYKSFDEGCEAYAAKPLDINKLVEVMKNLNLIK